MNLNAPIRFSLVLIASVAMPTGLGAQSSGTTSPLSVLRSAPRTRIEATPRVTATPVQATPTASTPAVTPFGAAISAPEPSRTGPASAYDLDPSAPAPVSQPQNPQSPVTTVPPSDPYGTQEFPPQGRILTAPNRRPTQQSPVPEAEPRRPGAARRLLNRINPFGREETPVTPEPEVILQPPPAAPAGTPSTVPGMILPGDLIDLSPNGQTTPSPDSTPAQSNIVPEPTPAVYGQPAPTPTVTAQPVPASNTEDSRLPNPKVEPNPVLLQNFTEGVQLLRDGRVQEAAQRFRDYATNHPMSGLTPRALYLSAALQPDLSQAAQSAQTLRRNHGSSVYVKMLRNRRPGVFEVVPASTPVAMQLQPTPTPVSALNLPPEPVQPREGDPLTPILDDAQGTPIASQPSGPVSIIVPTETARTPRPTPVGVVVDFQPTGRSTPGTATTTSTVVLSDATQSVPSASRILSIPSTETGPIAQESDLQSALNTPREPSVRIQVARGYLQARNPSKALEILAPAEQQTQGTMAQAEALALQAEAQIAAGSSADASKTLSTLIQNFPDSAGQPRIRLQLGLLSEEAGVVNRARNYYRAIIEDSPTSPEAKVARTRLEDLRGL